MRNKDKARPLTLTNDICLFRRNVFGFLSYVSTAAASYIVLISSNCVSIYIHIYLSHIYIYIFILYYISFYTLCILTHTLSFPSFFPSLHIYTRYNQHNASNNGITRTYTHARIILVDKVNILIARSHTGKITGEASYHRRLSPNLRKLMRINPNQNFNRK